MSKLNPVAVTSADLLRAIAYDMGWISKADLAIAAGRGPKNIARDLAIVVDAGLVAIEPELPPRDGITLTDEGKAQLAAIGRAEHGGQARRPRDRCLASKIIANPANRTVREQDVIALADTIEAVGDVLEAVQLTPSDANGARMLLDGEHRWRAVNWLEQEGRLPATLAEKGLLFEEREATVAEQILIRIVTATARADLSPLDDARQLLALQQATGWSAREIAKKTGRSPADSDVGVRDVQVKIRIAKEATPFFLAQYELDGSWDRLRDSVTQPKPRPSPEQELSQALAAHGTAQLASETRPQQAGEDPIAKVWETDQITHAREQGWEPGGGDHDGDWTLDSPWSAGATLEWTHKHDFIRMRQFHHEDGSCFVSLSTQVDSHGTGESYRVSARNNRAFPSRLEALKAARKRALDGDPNMPAAARDWLDQQLGPFYVNGVDRLNASNAGEARRALGWDKRHANSGGGQGKPTEGQLKPSTEAMITGFKAAAAPAAPEPTEVPILAGRPSTLDERADRMETAARDGSAIVLVAAISEIIDAAESHLSGLRRSLEQAGQDLTEFEDDTAGLREAMVQALDAVEGLGLGEGEGIDPVEPFSRRLTPDAPYVPIRKSITPEHITCLYDGRRFAGGLRRHLLTRYNETAEEYRRKWALSADYPMVAPNHAKRQHYALRAAALRSAAR